jgi:hypothetical protein
MFDLASSSSSRHRAGENNGSSHVRHVISSCQTIPIVCPSCAIFPLLSSIRQNEQRDEDDVQSAEAPDDSDQQPTVDLPVVRARVLRCDAMIEMA